MNWRKRKSSRFNEMCFFDPLQRKPGISRGALVGFRGPTLPVCYETGGRIKGKAMLRVPEHRFLIFAGLYCCYGCFRWFVTRKPVGVLRGCSASFSDCRRLLPG